MHSFLETCIFVNNYIASEDILIKFKTVRAEVGTSKRSSIVGHVGSIKLKKNHKIFYFKYVTKFYV